MADDIADLAFNGYATAANGDRIIYSGRLEANYSQETAQISQIDVMFTSGGFGIDTLSFPSFQTINDGERRVSFSNITRAGGSSYNITWSGFLPNELKFDYSIAGSQPGQFITYSTLNNIPSLQAQPVTSTLVSQANPGLSITGTSASEFLEGTVGSDTLTGAAGLDLILGGDGYDRLDGGDEADIVRGGSGDDTVAGGLGPDILTGDAGNDVVWGDAIGNTSQGDNDVMSGSLGLDTLHGGGGNDRLFGEESNDRLFGDDGDDELHGGADLDLVDGGNGNDLLFGEDGNDILDGGVGNDIMDGGAGRDVFIFGRTSGTDTIYNFVRGEDTIRLVGFGSDLSGATLTRVNSFNGSVISTFNGSGVIGNVDPNGNDVLVTFQSGDRLLVKAQGGADITGLNASDFQFA